MGVRWSSVSVLLGLTLSVCGGLMSAVGPGVLVQNVTCDLSHRCCLPCTHSLTDQVDTQWIKLSGDYPVLHRHNPPSEDFVHPHFVGKFQVLSERVGHSELCLQEAELSSEALYLCESRDRWNKYDNCRVNVTVQAAVRDIQMWAESEQIMCSSERLYPKPSLEWFPQNSTHLSNITVQSGSDGFYSTRGTLRLPESQERDLHRTVGCVVSSGRSRMKATWSEQVVRFRPGVDPLLLCAPPSEKIQNVTWTFNNQRSPILQGGGGAVTVSPEWKEKVKNVSAWGDLQLTGLSPEWAGLYTCRAHVAMETFISNSQLKAEPDHVTWRWWISGVFGVLGPLAFLVVLFICLWSSCPLREILQNFTNTVLSRLSCEVWRPLRLLLSAQTDVQRPLGFRASPPTYPSVDVAQQSTIDDESIDLDDVKVNLEDELINCDDELIDRDDVKVNLEDELIDRDDVKVNLEDELINVDDVKVNCDDELLDLDDELIDRDDELIDRDDELIDRDNELIDRDDELIDRDDELIDRDDELIDRDDELIDRDDELIDRDDESVNCDDELLDLDDELIARDDVKVDRNSFRLDPSQAVQALTNTTAPALRRGGGGGFRGGPLEFELGEFE